MKKYLLLLTLIIPIFLMAEVNDFSFNKEMTIENFSVENGIPTKKVKEYLEIPQNTDIQSKLSDLQINKEQAEKVVKQFKREKNSFMLVVTLVGMFIVFSSLIITGIIINQLTHFQGEKKKTNKKKSHRKSKSVSTQKDEPSSNAIVAAITTVYLHELEVEEQNNLLLTWQRANVSMWKAVNKVNVPNRNFFKAQRSER
ncbi:MAG: OadG family transporter subunit [Candidatus Cloacimonadota bacterium]|nr:OadG family transporter subunit [Candidatus Cloacimonadota bacterium]